MNGCMGLGLYCKLNSSAPCCTMRSDNINVCSSQFMLGSMKMTRTQYYNDLNVSVQQAK